MTEDAALFDKDLPIRREVLGADYVDASMAKTDDFMMAFQRATTAWAWGWAWGDETLDRKTRSLIALAMLTALNRAPEIKLHVEGAFALKAGAWFRRVRLLIISPDPRPSGRRQAKTPQSRPVQIS